MMSWTCKGQESENDKMKLSVVNKKIIIPILIFCAAVVLIISAVRRGYMLEKQ